MKKTAIKAMVAVVGVGAVPVLLVLSRAAPRPDAALNPAIEKATPAGATDGARQTVRLPQGVPQFAVASEFPRAQTTVPSRSPPVDREQCERTCGATCIAGPARELQCPKLCTSDDECESGALCLPVRGNGMLGTIRRCIVSDCSGSGTADQCGSGMACQYTGRMEGGVYRCVPVGTRSLGQPCWGSSPAGLCGRGLRCVLGTCQPESCESDSNCQKGYRCRLVAGGDGHSKCFPGCAADGDCPSGQVCVHAGATSLCTNARDTCLEAGCPAGLVCHIDRMSTADLRTACRAPCDPDKSEPACGPEAEEICVRTDFWNEQRNLAGVCFKKCVPSDPGSCPKNYACRITPEGGGRCFALPSGDGEPSQSTKENPT